MTTTSTEVAVRRWSDDELRNLNPNNLFDAITAKNVEVIDAQTVLGTGFDVLDDKEKLIDVPFYIVDWHESEGDNGSFTSLLVLTQDKKLVVNDGGSGIPNQIKTLAATSANAVIFVAKGLRKSVFYYNPDNVEEKSRDALPGFKKATTYYLAV